MSEISSAILFTPGRASYMETLDDGTRELVLSPASERRAQKAAVAFDIVMHEYAIFAGGYPGFAQGWAPEFTPAADDREAHHMAAPLKDRLIGESWSANQVSRLVKTQGESNNSIGDVLLSIRNGLLDPEVFNDETHVRSIDLVAGALHGRRFRNILSKALDIDPKRVRRLNMSDIYGTKIPETKAHDAATLQTLEPESAPVAIAKEIAAIAVTQKVMRSVRPGNVEDLAEAEQRFISIVQKAQG